MAYIVLLLQTKQRLYLQNKPNLFPLFYRLNIWYYMHFFMPDFRELSSILVSNTIVYWLPLLMSPGYLGSPQGISTMTCQPAFQCFTTCSLTQSHPTLCELMDCSMPGFPVLHHLPEFAQTYVHWVGDDIQPSHPLLFPSPSAFNLSQQQDLFKWVSSLHQVTKILEFQLQHQSFQWIFRVDFLSPLDISANLKHSQNTSEVGVVS